MDENTKNVALGLLGNFIWLIGGFTIAWIRRKLYGYLIVKRYIISFVLRKKYIIIWNDDSIDLSVTIKEKLVKKGLSKFIYKILKEPDELLYFPANKTAVQLVLLISTDVTKISEDRLKRLNIQKKLKSYVNNGGVLIGTHDIIYRRCRNTVLEQVFGCRIVQFERNPNSFEVKINKEFLKHPLLKNIPFKYKLFDGEITTGNWSNEVYQLVKTSEPFFKESLNSTVPVVCLKKGLKDGMAIWLSCADKVIDLNHSDSFDGNEFIQMVYNSIFLIKEIRKYNSQLLN